jgi:hypothetical protein
VSKVSYWHRFLMIWYCSSQGSTLCFAVIVVRLEEALGFDPFSVVEDVAFPVTLGDFIRVYEDAAK